MVGARTCLQQQEQDPTNLYISNLPAYVSEVDLEAMFSSYGKVISTRILRDPHGTSRGVGFARMDTKDTCEAIINAFNAKFLNGSYWQCRPVAPTPWGTGARVAPYFYKWLGTGDSTVSRTAANKKLTKLY